MAPLRDVLGRVVHMDKSVLGEDLDVEFRDLYDHVLRVYDELDTQRDLLTGILEAHLSVVSNRLNEVVLKLSSWAGIVLVPTLIAGIYGMNFRDMPELHWQFGYLYALGLMARPAPCCGGASGAPAGCSAGRSRRHGRATAGRTAAVTTSGSEPASALARLP